MMNHVYRERFPKVCIAAKALFVALFQFEHMYCPTLTKQSLIVNPPERNIADSEMWSVLKLGR